MLDTRLVEVGAKRPLLVVLDGPEYARRTGLVRRVRRLHADGEVPAHAVLLVTPEDRMETYSAEPRFARALLDLVDGFGARARPVGLGCSLGALALLHAHRLHPTTFAGLFLQSGSYFQRDTDSMEAGFARFPRIERFVGGALRARRAERPIPVTLTCGLDEDNYANNARLAPALARQGYPVEFHAARGGHDWPTWRRALDAHLAALLRRAWR